MKNEKFYDICEWMPIKDFDDNIYMKTGETLKILEVKPINFKLKSDIEQIAILESYKRFLKQCDFDIQIVVQAFKTNLNGHLESIEKYSYGNEKLNNMMKSYVNLIREISGDRKSITRRFFIVIKVDKNVDENINKIINGLASCGNEVVLCDSLVIREILENYFCKRKCLEK